MIQFIVFSRKRPLQLHGYLTSLFAQCSGEFAVSVLMKVDAGYEMAYADVAAEFPQVGFHEEASFAAQLAAFIGDAEFTCFGCDDVVFTGLVAEEAIWAAFKDPVVLGLSLRLGQHIDSDMFGGSLNYPAMELTDQGFEMWSVTDWQSVGDWAYPWEVLGTVYRTAFVRDMVAAIMPISPSQLEAKGALCWSRYTDLRHMAAYPTSRLVVPTVNVVQQEFPNGIRGDRELTPEFLLECWHNGLRLDTERYAGMAPPSWRVPDFYLRRVD